MQIVSSSIRPLGKQKKDWGPTVRNSTRTLYSLWEILLTCCGLAICFIIVCFSTLRNSGFQMKGTTSVGCGNVAWDLRQDVRARVQRSWHQGTAGFQITFTKMKIFSSSPSRCTEVY